MFFAMLLVVASASTTAKVFDARALDWAPLAGLTRVDKLSRVMRLFPDAKYFKRAEPDCEMPVEAPPGKMGCDTLYLDGYRFADGLKYNVRFSFDWRGGLSSIFLSGSDLDAERFRESADSLQLLLKHHYGHEICRMGGECYYGSTHAGRVELSPFIYHQGDGATSYSTSIRIIPR